MDSTIVKSNSDNRLMKMKAQLTYIEERKALVKEETSRAINKLALLQAKLDGAYNDRSKRKGEVYKISDNKQLALETGTSISSIVKNRICSSQNDESVDSQSAINAEIICLRQQVLLLEGLCSRHIQQDIAAKSELAIMASQRDEIQQNLNLADQLVFKVQAEKEVALAEVDQLKERILSLEKENVSLNDIVSNYKNQMDSAMEHALLLSEEKLSLCNDIEKLHDEIRSLKYQLSEHQQNETKLTSLIGDYRQNLAMSEKLVIRLEKEKVDTNLQIESFNFELSTLKDRQKVEEVEMTNKDNLIVSLQKQLTILSHNNENLQQDVWKTRDEITRLRNRITQLEEELEITKKVSVMVVQDECTDTDNNVTVNASQEMIVKENASLSTDGIHNTGRDDFNLDGSLTGSNNNDNEHQLLQDTTTISDISLNLSVSSAGGEGTKNDNQTHTHSTEELLEGSLREIQKLQAIIGSLQEQVIDLERDKKKFLEGKPPKKNCFSLYCS